MTSCLYRVGRVAGAGGVLLASVLLLSGCGGGGKKKETSASGKVTYNGQIVSGGSIALVAADGKGQPLKMPLNSNGTFTITQPPEGEMKVVIETESVKGQTGAPPPGMEKADLSKLNLPKYVKIPSSYGDANTTPLRWTIQKGENKKDFELTDAAK